MATAAAWDLRFAVGRAEAAELCQVSVDTIRRRLREGSFPHAWRSGTDQHWSIPLQDLVDAGMLPPAAVATALQRSAGAVADEVTPLQADSTRLDGDTHLAEARVEIRALRDQLARACDEIEFLRALLTREPVA